MTRTDVREVRRRQDRFGIHEQFAEKISNCHCEERLLRRGNLEVADSLEPGLRRCARKDGLKAFS